MINLGKKKLLGIPINVCDYEWITHTVVDSIKKNRGLLIFPLATHTLVESYFDKTLHNILTSYNILAPDSQWITWSLGWLYNIKLKKRVYSADMAEHIIAKSEEQKIPIFFFGTNDLVLSQLTKNLKSKYKSLNIVGSLSAPYRKITHKEKKNIINLINKSGAKIIFIALSSPQQVVLAHDLFKLSNKNITMIPVGAVFDFIAKTKKQAPRWMQNNGLEWFFRITQEPKRLFWRYLRTGSIFIFFILYLKFIGGKKKDEHSYRL